MLQTYVPSLRDPKIIVPVLVPVFLILLVLAGFNDSRLGTIAAHAPRGLVRIGIVLSDFGQSGYMFVLSAAIALGALWARAAAWGRAQRRQLTLMAERAIYFFAAIGVSGILAQVIKHIVGRARPKLLSEYGAFHFEPLSVKNVLASFPSGHSTTVFAAAVALSLIFPRARAVWFVIAAAIALSRIVVGAHYPSDVVGGAALGASVAYLVALVFARRSIAFDATSPGLRLKQAGPPVGAPVSTATEMP